ncbi:hypothetical protein D9V96_003455 [Zobellia laminariae]
MKNLEPIQINDSTEREEIKKIFDNQTNLLLGLIVFAVEQYFILLAFL